MSHLEERGREAGVFYSAGDLMCASFPEPKWAVPGLLAEGLNLLAGSPKLGKSWLALGLAISVASGGMALGKIRVDQGDVLVCALEDTARRLQSRLSILLGTEAVPARLDFVTHMPRLPDAAPLICGWLDDHPGARLVVIDVLRKVRPIADERSDLYGRDYEAMSQLKAIADKYSVAILAIHHTRKSEAEDVFDTVSGSNGLTGAADAILVAKRLRNSATAELHLTGRDVEERSYALEWLAESCTWGLLEEPVEVIKLSDTRRRILDHLATVEAATPTQIADALALKLNTVKPILRRMADDLQVDSDGRGNYLCATATQATDATQPALGLQGLQGLQVVREDA